MKCYEIAFTKKSMKKILSNLLEPARGEGASEQAQNTRGEYKEYEKSEKEIYWDSHFLLRIGWFL